MHCCVLLLCIFTNNSFFVLLNDIETGIPSNMLYVKSYIYIYFFFFFSLFDHKKINRY